MITIEQVKKSLDNENPLIEWARTYNKKLRLHVNGEFLQDFLARINSYENELQFEARKKHAISNKFITEELLRPVDNAFAAKGGSRNYIFDTNQDKNEKLFVDNLLNVKNGTSLGSYIENIWFNKFVTDPNGLTMIETDSEGVAIKDEEAEDEAQLMYKSIHCIRDYKQNGINVDWVIFEPHRVDVGKDDIEVKFFWVVDEANYYLYSMADKLKLIEEPIPHGFKKVPAVLNSNIVNNVNGWKLSPIDAQIELLDKYVVSNSVLSIAEFFHNFPREYTYIDECSHCSGEGKVAQYETRPGVTSTVCTVCDGTGKAETKDVTDLIKLRIPSKDEHKLEPPGGYITLPTEAWELMTDSVDRTFRQIYFSQWHAIVDKDSKNETATGRFLDAQPVNNRLNKYSKTFEIIHSALANFLGEFYFPATFKKAVVQYGRRYLIETPDQIWEKYLKAKTDNAPISVLDLLLMQYLESEFRENEQLFIYEFKKVKLEPFVHWDVETVRGATLITPDDAKKKEYFSEWIKQKDRNEIIKTDIEKLEKEFNTFVVSKIITNEE